MIIRRIGHDHSSKPKEEGDDGASPKSVHKLNQNLDHSSTATSAMGLPPTPPDDLEPAAAEKRAREKGDGEGDTDSGGLFRNGLPLVSSPSSAGSITRYS